MLEDSLFASSSFVVGEINPKSKEWEADVHTKEAGCVYWFRLMIDSLIVWQKCILILMRFFEANKMFSV
jgi:hypothetical protein